MRAIVRTSVGPIIALVLFAASAAAQGFILPRACWSYIEIGDGPRPVARPMPGVCPANVVRTASAVRVALADGVLHYEVDERFVNRGAALQEADYVFPLPGGAAFEDLRLSINGELVAGETMDAGRARGIYENIVRARRDPALVEWMGHGLVRARVFPINPGEEKRVIIRFDEVAPREGDALRIDYVRGGGVSAGGAMPNVREAGTETFTLRYRPTPALGTPYSPTHQLDFADSAGFRIVMARGQASDLTVLIPTRKASEPAISVLPYAPGGIDSSGFALITVTPPATSRSETTPRDITLVLDVSGSMSGRKIEQARAAGRQLLGTLRPSDRFRLIDFSSDVRTFRDDFAATTPENIGAATRYLDGLEAIGGTNIEGALREALRPAPARGRLPLVLFVTDGEPTIGDPNTDDLTRLVRDANAHAAVPSRIFTFGLGSDVNVSLLEQLALDGRGTSQFVRPTESVERLVGVVANELVDPVLTDVRVRADGGVTLEKMIPSEGADLFADHDLVVLARYTGHGPARIIIEGIRRGSPEHWTSNADFPERSRDNAFVARLWATQRVGFLAAEKRTHGGGAEIDDEIRRLGERYGIPTEFTSYLVSEPALVSNVGMGIRRGAMGAPMATSAVARRHLQFEAAKTASAQRVAVTTAVLDSLAATSVANGGVYKPAVAGAVAAGVTVRRVDGRTFELRDGVWTDTRYQPKMPTITIEPYSRAYFDLLARLPELRTTFALGDRLVVVGRARAIVVGPNGKATLTATELDALARSW